MGFTYLGGGITQTGTDTMTATEVNERAIEIDARAVLQSEDEIAARVAGALIEAFGDDLSADQLEQLLAIRDGNESCAT